MRLLQRPASLPVLHAPLVRELHHWLMTGRHRPAIRRLGWPEGHTQRITRAVAVLRAEFSRPLRIERLAGVAGMSPSSSTSISAARLHCRRCSSRNILRLIEARRLMRSEGLSASGAAFAVGYESVPQFTREYGRMFGLSPVRDTQLAREWAKAAA